MGPTFDQPQVSMDPPHKANNSTGMALQYPTYESAPDFVHES